MPGRLRGRPPVHAESMSSLRRLSPSGGPGPRTRRARSISPHYRFGDAANHAFTSATGSVGTCSPSFGMSELRDALPTTRPRPLSSSGAPTPPPRLLFPDQVNEEIHSWQDRSAHSEHNSSDVSIVSGLDEEYSVAPYDVRNEKGPEHRFFTAEFQSTLQAGLGIAGDTLALLEGLDGVMQGDRDLEKLLGDAKKLCAFHGTDTKTIAVLGDSGEGKSSLINSLLHFPGIAKTGDIGSACTSVVTEYRQKTGEHTAPITIEVEHLSGAAIEEVIKELLWSYRQLYLPGVEDESTSAEDYAQYQRESAQAWSALEAAFSHKQGFKEGMLRDMSEGAIERLTAQLVGWAREIQWPDGTDGGLWRSTADTAEECAGKTALFMQDRYWPFTKIIRVYLNAQVLKTGVVLADLPGLQDTNLARVRATHDYLLKCNHVFIVAKISRAITDRSLQSSLFSVLSRHVPLEWEESAAQSLRIAVVCTKVEDIDIQAARREFCGPDKSIRDSVVDDLDAQIEDAKVTGNRMLKKALKQRRELLLINARNAHVTSGLQAAYAARAPGGHLDVFCVSNRWYDKYARKGNVELVRASGIPALRQFCHSITADAQLREARHFLRSRVFTLVNSAELWVGGRLRSQPRRNEFSEAQRAVLRVNDGMMRVFAAAIDTLVANFRSCFVEQVLNIIGTGAAYYSKMWHWTQYDAWCRNNGHHSTAKRGRVDWNAKIIWKLRTELDFQWDIVAEEINTVFGKLLAIVSEQFGALKAAISALSTPSVFRTQLSAVIGPRTESMQYSLTRAQEKFAHEVNHLRRYASEPSHGSYILDAMISTYRAASNQYANVELGTGKNKRQIGIVEGRITDGALFPSAAIALQDRMDTLLERLKARLTATLAEAVEDIRTDLGFVLSPILETQRNDVGLAADRNRLREILERLGTLKVQAEDVRRAAAE
ncbi:hypothetical protein C8A03DRAFT_46215 [Achaetomium macrosporum]|uniref:Uncharacterized protein n=1 Tax=Achaetomium macrosporum TaxID=79813 RepID=A0AAN7C6K5_9PEZI|nr:hypothetical protein C8A03DRAFT_46215 [Achaetomium macrosporum]